MHIFFIAVYEVLKIINKIYVKLISTTSRCCESGFLADVWVAAEVCLPLPLPKWGGPVPRKPTSSSRSELHQLASSKFLSLSLRSSWLLLVVPTRQCLRLSGLHSELAGVAGN